MTRKASPREQRQEKSPPCRFHNEARRRPSPRPISRTSARLFVPGALGSAVRNSTGGAFPSSTTAKAERGVQQSTPTRSYGCTGAPASFQAAGREVKKSFYQFRGTSGNSTAKEAATANAGRRAWNDSTRVELENLPADASQRKHPGWEHHGNRRVSPQPPANGLTGWQGMVTTSRGEGLLEIGGRVIDGGISRCGGKGE